MREIHIATVILKKRKEKGITQDALANYLGVSKASVSKWETNASYPDIALLPQLATYFDISIDELMGYNPQLSKEQLRELHLRFTEEVTKRPPEETIAEWREIIRKYYACYPLLMLMSSFMLNNLDLAITPQQRDELVHEIITLYKRVRLESQDAHLAELALKSEACCYLVLNEPEKTLVLLEELVYALAMPPELLAASAHQMMGDLTEAKSITQVGLLQNLIVHFNFLTNYLNMVLDDTAAFNATVERIHAVADAYQLAKLHPYLQLSNELVIAIGYATRGEQEQALATLEVLAHLLVHNKAPLDLHGDTFFNLVDAWLGNLDTGNQLPRNALLVRENFISAIAEHPAFACLTEDKRYQRILAQLKG